MFIFIVIAKVLYSWVVVRMNDFLCVGGTEPIPYTAVHRPGQTYCNCLHMFMNADTLTRGNYLCAELAIVVVLFGALQGGGPWLLNNTAACFSRSLCSIAMTVKVSLPQLFLSVPFSPFHLVFSDDKGKLSSWWERPLHCASLWSTPD